MTNIRVMGNSYDKHEWYGGDGCVVECDGFTFTSADTGYTEYWRRGDTYMGGTIIDCFIHPESDCIWAIIECEGVYFEVEPDHNGHYGPLINIPGYIEENLPII